MSVSATDLRRRYETVQEKKNGVATVRMTDSTLALADGIASSYGRTRGAVLSDMVSLGLQMFLDDQESRRLQKM